MDYLMPLLVTSAPRALFIILFVVGLVMAVARRAQHPNASRLAIIAFVVLIAGELVQVASQAYLFTHNFRATPDFARTLGYFSMGSLALSVTGMTLLVLAVFADRSPQPAPLRPS